MEGVTGKVKEQYLGGDWPSVDSFFGRGRCSGRPSPFSERERGSRPPGHGVVTYGYVDGERTGKRPGKVHVLERLKVTEQ